MDQIARTTTTRRKSVRLRSALAGLILAGTAATSLIAARPADASHVSYNYRQVVVRHSQMCLNVAHASPYDGAGIVQATCTGYNNERWDIRHVDTDWWTGYKYFEFRVRHTGKCLDVPGGSTGYVQLQQWGCNGGRNQQFRFVDLGNDGYQFIIARHSDKCIETANGSYDHAAPIMQNTCGNTGNQHWKLRS